MARIFGIQSSLLRYDGRLFYMRDQKEKIVNIMVGSDHAIKQVVRFSVFSN